MGKVISASMTLLVISVNLNAGSSDHSDHHHQEAHFHGLAQMTMALEGDTIELNLESPAANIVGFEHRAATSRQRQLVNEAKTALESSKQLFSFSGTSCELTEVDVDVSALLDNETLETKEEKHEKNGHGHHDHSDHGKSDEATHSDISAHYRFQCDQGAKLTAISLKLFEHFPGVETLNAEWITDNNQGSAELTAGANTLYLKRSL